MVLYIVLRVMTYAGGREIRGRRVRGHNMMGYSRLAKRVVEGLYLTNSGVV